MRPRAKPQPVRPQPLGSCRKAPLISTLEVKDRLNNIEYLKAFHLSISIVVSGIYDK